MSFSRIIRNYKQLGKLGTEIMEHKSIVGNLPRGKIIDDEFKKQHEKIELFIDIQKETAEISKDVNYLINEYWTGWD
tara:strand:- start:118 stop:348 length:231 start_codon:yes stop_codon:yes gene_type:complete